MAASASIVGWSRDAFWPQASTRHRSNHLAMGPGSGVSTTSAALPTEQHQQVATLADQELLEGNGSGDGGDYSLRAHELIASPNSLYEVLETLGKRREKERGYVTWLVAQIRVVRAAVC